MNLLELLDNKQEYRKELSELKFLEILKEQAKNSHTILKKMPIFREDSGSDFMLVDPSKKDTKSSFWIDKLVQDLPGWNRYPSRARFLKGYTSVERVGGSEDSHYVVIPLDRARIGICPTASFYKSFKLLNQDLNISRVDNDGLANWIETIFKAVSNVYPEAKLEVRQPETFAQFKRMLTELDKELKGNQSKISKLLSKSEEVSDEEKIYLKDLLSRHITSTESYLGEKLDPDQNKFGSIKVESLTAASDDREVWINDPCLLIKRSKYIELHKKGTIK